MILTPACPEIRNSLTLQQCKDNPETAGRHRGIYFITITPKNSSNLKYLFLIEEFVLFIKYTFKNLKTLFHLIYQSFNLGAMYESFTNSYIRLDALKQYNKLKNKCA
jgi:hypothetical protein